MKKYLLNMICFMALAITAIPVTANDYLKIYFKDGHTERHYMHLVESISTTKYDLEGNLHDDYQMQQIVMPDTTYSYYLADIDSMSFIKVNEDQLKFRVASVQSSLESIFQQCSNMEDLASHVDEIKSIDGVEDVYYDGDNLFVQIRDWFDICINHQPIPENFISSANLLDKKNGKRLMPTTEDGSQMKVTIGFQPDKDKDFANRKEVIDDLFHDFSTMEYKPTNYYLGDEMDLDFFLSHIFDSNLLLIVTHCFYNPLNNQHYLYTGIESSSNDLVGLGFDRLFNISKNIDLDDISISRSHYNGGNLFDNPFNHKWFISVKENYIRKSPYRFSGSGPHIVFVAACSSLERSNSFAQVFFDKGADVYLGYKSATYWGPQAAASFFDYMMHGASVEKAYNLLSPVYKSESDKEEDEVILVDLYNEDSGYNNPKSLFIVNTHSIEKTEQEFQTDFYNNETVELKGETAISSSYHGSEEEDFGSVYGFLYFGFVIATQPNVDNFANDETITSSNSHFTNRETGEVAFSAMFTPIPEKNYYYRAFTYDGIHYNWGEERSFTIYKPLSLSTKAVSLKVGESSTVDITAGSGEYKVDDMNSPYVEATLQGTVITISAVSVGDATVVVTDKKTGQQITIEVAVTKDDAPTDIPAEPIDLGLPSGTKWASCNVGATKPEEYGGYYAWGETEENGYYDWSYYKYYQNGSYVSLGSDISGTEYDVAHVKWGGNWVIPTQEQQQELLDNCTNEWTTLNGVNGRKFTSKINGNSIFLPAAGYRVKVNYTTTLRGCGEGGLYWSSVQDSLDMSRAYHIDFYSGRANSNWGYYVRGLRYNGFSVRPVIHSTPTLADLTLSSTEPITVKVDDKATVEITSGNGDYTAESDNEDVAIARVYDNATVRIKGVSVGSATITVTDTKSGQTATIAVTVTGAINPDVSPGEAIDLGLPSGTKWASCNVGATKPEEYGGYYAWGETEEKSYYDWSTYIHCDGSWSTCHDLGSDISGTEYDVAHVKWGGDWRMPTHDEQVELLNNCTSEWTTLNGVNGRKFTSNINGNSIFLPAAGYRWSGDLDGAGSYGIYWSSTQDPSYSYDAYYLDFYSGGAGWDYYYGYYRGRGHSVRPVVRN